MNTPVPEVHPFDPTRATDQDFDAWNAFANHMQAERMPSEPAIPLDQTVRYLKLTSPLAERYLWAAWSDDGQELIARADMLVLLMEENKHMAQLELEVLPEWRRRGLGTRFLERAVTAADEHQRQLLLTFTYDTVPEGSAFMRRIGGEAALAQHLNQLELADLDRELLRRWQEQARERASGLELVVWEGPPYPEAEIEAVSAMLESVNLMPRGDLDVEDFHFTPDQVRELDKIHAQQGYVRWTMVVRDPANARIAGFTEVAWRPGKPDLIEQYGTAVFPEYQNRGIGRWLKAAMLEKILRDRPEATRVHTGNADSNAPMLSINTQLGFKPYVATTSWQVQTDRVRDFVKARRERAAARR